MNQKTVKLIRRYAQSLGYDYRRTKKFYLALDDAERFMFKMMARDVVKKTEAET